MICPSMPIPASTELRIYLYFVSQKIIAPRFWYPLLLAYGGIYTFPLTAATYHLTDFS